MFFVYTAYGVYNCQGSGTNPACGFVNGNANGPYCAYHSAYETRPSNPLAVLAAPIVPLSDTTLWAAMGDEATDIDPVGHTTSCSSGGLPRATQLLRGTGGRFPNNDAAADATINVTSHELFEMVTDPIWTNAGHGWTDSAGPVGEIGDKCAWRYGTIAADGSTVTLNGHNYTVQQEWSNATFDGHTNYSGCALAKPAVATAIAPLPYNGPAGR